MENNYSKAIRLGWVLKRYSEDNETVSKITEILNYASQDDMKKDMQAVVECINELRVNWMKEM